MTKKMSELKVYPAYSVYNRAATPEESLVYLKSEADKVIAELEESHKMEVGQLLIFNREQANSANRLRDSMEQVIRHQKHKRCVAMASNCRLRARWFGDNAFYKKEQWALRWHKRWLKISEKFKEAK